MLATVQIRSVREGELYRARRWGCGLGSIGGIGFPVAHGSHKQPLKCRRRFSGDRLANRRS
jgi:hypothetical protein